jgi:hypothetical protein
MSKLARATHLLHLQRLSRAFSVHQSIQHAPQFDPPAVDSQRKPDFRILTRGYEASRRLGVINSNLDGKKDLTTESNPPRQVELEKDQKQCREGESNPWHKLGRLVCYHYTTATTLYDSG